MIEFRVENDLVIAKYFLQSGASLDWLYETIAAGNSQTFQKTFTFSEIHLYEKLPEEIPIGYEEPVNFIFARKIGNYFKIEKSVLVDKFDVYISEDIEITKDLFVAYDNTAVFRKIEELIDEDIYIGGNSKDAIPESDFVQLINDFPTDYERKLYYQSRVSAVLKNYFSTTLDTQVKFEKYLNKKATLTAPNLKKTFQEVELLKYETILEKLQAMLLSENGFNEHSWQKEILDIILLLYPKYIKVFTGTPINSDNIKGKFLDLLLLDANGNIDIIEIKKPAENYIVTQKVYRDNHIPLRELSGAVMQIEKYIFYLNRWGARGERYLTEKYKSDIPDGMDIKIINPRAIIITGRENNLSPTQKYDFEIVKRKYKNVVDIITYDSLLERLKFTIEQIKLL